MEPARVQVQLHVLSRLDYPSRNPAHRLIAEIGGLQGFDEKRRSHPERGEAIEQKAEAVLLPINCSQHDGLGDWGQLRVVEIATDTEFSIDGNAHLGGFTQFHGP